MIHFVNSRVARDTVWELEGEHVIQPGNWRRARDAVWELDNRLTSGKIRSGSQKSIPVGSYSSPSVAKGGGGGGGGRGHDTFCELEGST